MHDAVDTSKTVNLYVPIHTLLNDVRDNEQNATKQYASQNLEPQ